MPAATHNSQPSHIHSPQIHSTCSRANPCRECWYGQLRSCRMQPNILLLATWALTCQRSRRIAQAAGDIQQPAHHSSKYGAKESSHER
ncbi:hypothetical protein HaLaN_14557 [Haematococcus lacustris]|uniref:Uncharacterized protein n=1 Tax=Haematococcus lacustris TaxID=44745 RepID=A0A699Z8F2_HAELA|nr:hypothetical protein HaLaN_14557 [Haematococcus lacustris]